MLHHNYCKINEIPNGNNFLSEKNSGFIGFLIGSYLGTVVILQPLGSFLLIFR